MPAILTTYDDETYTYESAKEVKKEGTKYVVYDGYGNVLGVHQIEHIKELTTVPL